MTFTQPPLFLNSLSAQDFNRRLRHPENGIMDLNMLLALYSWHGRHHEGHITNLRKKMGWTLKKPGTGVTGFH